MSDDTYERLKKTLLATPSPGVPLVILSGGFDSALIIQALAEMQIQFDVAHIPSMYVGAAKRVRELDAFYKITKKYADWIVQSSVYSIPKLNSYEKMPPRYALPWAHATGAAMLTRDVTSCVLTGYLLTDENKVDTAFENIYHGALQTFHPQHWDGKALPKHIMPLHNVTKCEVMSMIDIELAKNLTFCESVHEVDNCGVCRPCSNFNAALLGNTISETRKMELLQQSNRTEGMLHYLAEQQRSGEDMLFLLGLATSDKTWSQIRNDYLISRYKEDTPGQDEGPSTQVGDSNARND